MDEDFENLSISSSDEWAIVDDNSDGNLVTTELKFCSICGVELDQLVYTRACCQLCPVCYSCYQNYPSSTFPLQCEHTKEILHNTQHLHSPKLLVDTNAREEVTLKGKASSNSDHTATADKEEDDISVLCHVQHDKIGVLPISSSPRLIPSLHGFDAPTSAADTSYRRYSLSWSDGEVVSGSESTDSDRPERVATTAAVGASSGLASHPTNELTAKLASFEFAPASSLRCAPKPIAPIAGGTTVCTSRPAGVTGASPPTATSFFVLGNSAIASRSPLPSPPSTMNLSPNCSGSPMNSAAQFLKSVVKHSATALNNFDFLPMHPWDGIQRETNTAAGLKGGMTAVSAEPDRSPTHVVKPPTSATQMAADQLMLPITQNSLSGDKLQALLAPKTIPKCVFEASAYTLR